jgi:Glycosyl transferase family 11
LVQTPYNIAVIRPKALLTPSNSRYGYIGMLQTPVGRFGNHLSQANSIYQLSYALNCGEFHRNFIGSRLFPVLKRKNLNLPVLARRGRFFSFHALKELDEIQRLEAIREVISAKRNAYIDSTVLDLMFFDKFNVHPKKFFNIQQAPSFDTGSHQNSKIALHFRGTDFLEWNPKALMKPKYYIDALEVISKEANLKDFEITLYTDDPENATVQEVLKYKGIKLSQNANMFEDFARIANSNYLIASPSSFAIWAGILGNDKKIYISRDWVEHRMQSGDDYWTRLSNNESPFIQFSSWI